MQSPLSVLIRPPPFLEFSFVPRRELKCKEEHGKPVMQKERVVDKGDIYSDKGDICSGQTLSLPILYEIFQIGDLENNLACCCREFRDILTSEHFWKKRLARLDLPLLQKGSSFAQWKSIYRFSLQVAREEKKNMLLSLCKIPNLDYLTCEEVDKEKVFGFLSLARKYRAYRHSSELFVYVSREEYGSTSSFSYKIFSAERKDFFNSRFAKKVLFYTPLCEKSYKLLLYKLSYAEESS